MASDRSFSVSRKLILELSVRDYLKSKGIMVIGGAFFIFNILSAIQREPFILFAFVWKIIRNLLNELGTKAGENE